MVIMVWTKAAQNTLKLFDVHLKSRALLYVTGLYP